MKTIFSLLIGCALSLSAQVKEDWTVKIPDVKLTADQLLKMQDELLIGHAGAVLIDFSRFNNQDLDGDELADPLTKWVWLSSKWKIIYRAIFNDRISPNLIMGGVVMFNDDCIVITERYIPSGRLSFFKVDKGKLVKTRTDFEASAWVGFPNTSRNSSWFNGNGSSFVLGLSSSAHIGGTFSELSRYSIELQSPTFWVQQSEDLETWKDVVEVPQGETPKEFFRIKPE